MIKLKRFITNSFMQFTKLHVHAQTINDTEKLNYYLNCKIQEDDLKAISNKLGTIKCKEVAMYIIVHNINCTHDVVKIVSYIHIKFAYVKQSVHKNVKSTENS